MDDDIYNGPIIEGSLFDYWSTPEKVDPFSPLGRFARLMQLPDEELDLAEAALMIAAQEYPGLNEVYYFNQLDELADEVRPLTVTEDDPRKCIEHLIYFLTQLKGFHGNSTNYNDRRNSYLNDVLERKTGIPILLSLLYIELGNRLGLPFEGIGLPGHFVIRYRQLASQPTGRGDRFGSNEEPEHAGGSAEQEEIFLDPFNGGAIVTEEDLHELIKERNRRVIPIHQALNRPYTKRQFLSRMLHNLKVICVQEQDWERALDFQQFLIELDHNSAEEKRDRGILYLKLERYGRAISDLQAYLRQIPQASDAELMRQQLSLAFDQLVQRN
jgi:regulator of sirC expression with transglutaminase-like and TPR domain